MINKNNNLTEKQLKKLNSKLLKCLETSLEIMSITRCPYFILNGYGSIYMDESYIKRRSINIDNDETKQIMQFKSSKERNEYYDKRLNALADEIKNFAKEVSNFKSAKENIQKEPNEFKIGKTLNDLLDDKPNKIENIKLEKPNEFVEVIPDITKDQAVEQVTKGQKAKDWGMITNINKYKAKSKIGETYDSEEDK